MTKNTICGDITIERIDMSQPQRIAYTITEPEIDSDTIDDAIAAFKKRCADSASSHAAMTWGTTETDKGIDAILEIVISVNGEYFDSEVSPAKIGTKEVQVLMGEVA